MKAVVKRVWVWFLVEMEKQLIHWCLHSQCFLGVVAVPSKFSGRNFFVVRRPCASFASLTDRGAKCMAFKAALNRWRFQSTRAFAVKTWTGWLGFQWFRGACLRRVLAGWQISKGHRSKASRLHYRQVFDGHWLCQAILSRSVKSGSPALGNSSG